MIWNFAKMNATAFIVTTTLTALLAGVVSGQPKHGRTADIDRDFSAENLADDVAALLDFLRIPKADVIGYSLGGGVAMQYAIRHPEKARKVVIISYAFRSDGWVKEKNDAMATPMACGSNTLRKCSA